MGERIFGQEFYERSVEPPIELLSTIRVPKNLLYLTDRLPKAHYEHEKRSQQNKVAASTVLKRNEDKFEIDLHTSPDSNADQPNLESNLFSHDNLLSNLNNKIIKIHESSPAT